MIFLLINGCGHSFFWIGASEFTNIIIVTKKGKQTKQKFAILQSIGSSECLYFI